MSQRNNVSNPSAGGQCDAPPLTTQEKLSARQAERAAKAAERREKSGALKEEGNVFFRKGDYESAVDRYKQAIRVHGRSVKPVLLTNLAIAYYNLGKFPEANEAAEKALDGDPKSVKARYRRAMARKSMEMWRAAAIDFRIVLRLDPRYQEAKKELAYVEKCQRENWTMEDDDVDNDSEYELPAPDDNPELGESLSESSDCEHTGNGEPCKLYNRTERTKGRACPFSHAPDNLSERDALGRNVCRQYLMSVCKSGESRSYLHSKEFLLQKGFWSTAKGTDRERNVHEVQQKFQRAFIDFEENNPSIPETRPVPEKKHPKGKKKGSDRTHLDLRRSRPDVAAIAGRDRQTRNTVNPDAKPEGTDSDDQGEEYGMFGFTNSEVEELLCHGIKPWEDHAEARVFYYKHFLEALYDARRKTDDPGLLGED